METVCRLGGFLCQLLISGQVIVLYIGKGSGQRSINGKAQSVLIGKRPFPVFLPFPIIPILALASGLRVLHDGQPVFKAQPVREPTEGETGAPKVSEFPGAVKGGGVVINVCGNFSSTGHV